MTSFEVSVNFFDLSQQTLNLTLIQMSEFFLPFKAGKISLDVSEASAYYASAPPGASYRLRNDMSEEA